MVKKSCCVDGCDADGESEGVTFHRFPSNRILKRKWIRSIDLGDKVTIQTLVCSQHFKDDDFDLVRGRKKLKNNAIPKYNLNLSSSNSESDLSNFDENEINKLLSAMENHDKVNYNAEGDLSDKIEDGSEIVSEKNEDSLKKNGTKQVKENGISHIDADVENHVNSIHPPSKPTDPDDIEDLLTNYQIKQNDILREKLQASLKEKENLEEKPPDKTYVEVEVEFGLNPTTGDPEPFIEVPTSIDRKGNTQTDCLMMMENVQCEIDPSNLLNLLDSQEPSEETRDSHSASEVEIIEKKEAPISLLTSSDEDDVILQEPKIDTVEVSSADTDEDDMPLKRLAKSTPAKSKNLTFSSITWGANDYFCMKCNCPYPDSKTYYKHKLLHKTVTHICNVCNYQTSSMSVMARHKRKHKEEKLFECHFCMYRAKHKMSLVYHLNTHTNESASGQTPVFSCDTCHFRSFHKFVIENHVRKCGVSKSVSNSVSKRVSKSVSKKKTRSINMKRDERRSSSVEADKKEKENRFSCRKCSFKCNRKFDMKRHVKRKHKEEDSDVTDDDFRPPPYVK